MRVLAALMFGAALVSLSFTACRKNDEAFEVLTPPERPAELSKLWPVPDFKLTTQQNKPLTRADLAGKVWVADFFYASCPGPCPMMQSRLAEIHRATNGQADVALVSISTDPAKDTPEVLREYAARFKADERWSFVTGDKDAIYDLANSGFKLTVTNQGATEREPVTHSTKLALVDKAGVVRGFYEGVTAEDVNRLLADIAKLRSER